MHRTAEEKEMMETRQRIQTRIILGLLVAALVLTIVPHQGRAAVSSLCTAPIPVGRDSDGNGLTDAEECAPLTLPPGAQRGAAGSVTFLPCDGSLARATCLDAGSKDIFVIQVLPSTGSHIRRLMLNVTPPIDPLGYVSSALSAGGLGIITHVITPAQAPTVMINGTNQGQVAVVRAAANCTPNVPIPCFQKVVKYVENVSSTTGDILGVADQGGINTSTSGVSATVYTARMLTFINSVYANAGITPTTATLDAVLTPYILHTLAHEFGHALALTVNYDRKLGGNHLQPRNPALYIMEQFVTYSGVNFSISDDWDSQSQSAADLF